MGASAVYLGNNTVLAKTQYGFKMYLDSRDLGIAPHIMLDGMWEEWVGVAMSRFLPQAYFFDIGANVGWFSLFAAHCKAKHVFAFEPEPSTFRLLQRSVKVNGAPVTCFSEALGDDDNAEGVLNVFDGHPGSNSLLGEVTGDDEITVRVRTLDSMFLYGQQVWDTRAPRVFKIDVEGFEPQVIAGGKGLIAARETQALFIEYNSYSGTEPIKEMLDFLLGQSFILGVVEHTQEIRKITREDLSSLPDASMLCFRRFSV